MGLLGHSQKKFKHYAPKFGPNFNLKSSLVVPQPFNFHLRQECVSYFFSGPVAKLAFMKIEILKNLEMQRNQNIPSRFCIEIIYSLVIEQA